MTAFLLFILAYAVLAAGQAAQAPLRDPSLDAGNGTRAAVACESEKCSRIGRDLIQAGGNAADAMIGMVLCVSVIGMYHSGPGGGGFFLVRKPGPDAEYEVIDSRETAPAAAHKNMFKGKPDRATAHGGLSIAVPGELKGLEYLHKRYGALKWAELFKSAIDLARNGFEVNHDLWRYVDFARTDISDFLTSDPAWAKDFAPNGTLIGPGERMKRERYARTLEEIASGGADVFYSGKMAEQTAKAVQNAGGILTVDDLRNYKLAIRKPVSIDYRGYRVYSCGSPASGAVVLSALKTVEGYEDFGDQTAVNVSTHRLDEAIRFGYGERTRLGDPEYIDGILDYEQQIISSSSASVKRDRISDSQTHNISYYNPAGYLVQNDHGTSHFVAADGSGLAISYTTTVNLIFGSNIMVPETGVILNDEMDDFSIPHRKNAFKYPPQPHNFIAPGKRPLSSIAPLMAEHRGNGTLAHLFGSAGGSRIITAGAQYLWHALDHGMAARRALAEPRFHDQLMPDNIRFEWPMGNRTNSSSSGGGGSPGRQSCAGGDFCADEETGIGTGEVRGYDNATVAFMKSLGHDVFWVAPGFSTAQAIQRHWNGTWEAANEPRQANSGSFTL